MALLPILLALKTRKAPGQDSDELLDNLVRALDRFRPMMRANAKGQLAEEDALLNAAAQSIYGRAKEIRADTEAAAVSYCRRAVVTKLLDHVRKSKGRLIYVGRAAADVPGYEPDVPDGTGHHEGAGNSVAAVDERANPEALVLRNETRERVWRALAQLSQLEQALVQRVGLRGERIRDIAATTGEKENTVTKRWRRARLKLRKILLALEAQGK